MFVVFALFAAPNFAQTINGTISGSVVDPQDAVVTGATVTATNNDTGASRTGVTGDDGTFRLTGLTVGIYTVKVEGKGFAPQVNNSVQVSVATDTSLSFKLATGFVEAVVTVVSTGEVLDTTQSQVSKTIGTKQIIEILPLSRQTLSAAHLITQLRFLISDLQMSADAQFRSAHVTSSNIFDI